MKSKEKAIKAPPKAKTLKKVTPNPVNMPSNQLSCYYVHPADAMPKNVREFYQAQNELITEFLQIEHLLAFSQRESCDSSHSTVSDTSEEETPLQSLQNVSIPIAQEEGMDQQQPQDILRQASSQCTWVITVCLVGNVILFSIAAFAAISTGSLSILASALDSFLDLVSGMVLYLTSKAKESTSRYDYPVGKTRMEPLGIIVFSAIMATASLQLLLQALERFFHPDETIHLTPSALSILVVVMIGKFALWMLCFRYQTRSQSIKALAQEHRNDFILNFSSFILMILTVVFNIYWLDSVGAIALAMYIIRNWTVTGLENIRNLTGRSANPREMQLITYLVYHFHPAIEKIETIRAYYAGNGLLVEVDVVLPPSMTLRQAHNIGESLQVCIESLRSLNVERAFVHLDYDWNHEIEHTKRISVEYPSPAALEPLTNPERSLP